MAVNFDATNFRNRLSNLRSNLLRTQLENSVADRSAEDIAGIALRDYQRTALSKYQWDKQVGINRETFMLSTNAIYKTGDASYGILSERDMGGEADIDRIFGLPGYYHEGHKAFKGFAKSILGNAARRQHLEILRSGKWGGRIPQWIYLEYGQSGDGEETTTAPGNALQRARNPKFIFAAWKELILIKLRSMRL